MTDEHYQRILRELEAARRGEPVGGVVAWADHAELVGLQDKAIAALDAQVATLRTMLDNERRLRQDLAVSYQRAIEQWRASLYPRRVHTIAHADATPVERVP